MDRSPRTASLRFYPIRQRTKVRKPGFGSRKKSCYLLFYVYHSSSVYYGRGKTRGYVGYRFTRAIRFDGRAVNPRADVRMFKCTFNRLTVVCCLFFVYFRPQCALMFLFCFRAAITFRKVLPNRCFFVFTGR